MHILLIEYESEAAGYLLKGLKETSSPVAMTRTVEPGIRLT
jgi:hypothetical protein